MHSTHSYIVLYMYVCRSQEADETLKWCVSYMYLTLCYNEPPLQI